MLSSVEKEVIDQLMDEGPILCGLLDKSVVQRLLSRGLVYLNVPVNPEDFVFGILNYGFFKLSLFKFDSFVFSTNFGWLCNEQGSG